MKIVPKLLDLYCGAGGAGEGYRLGGFDVTGVDIKPQPKNPHAFVLADALEYLAAYGDKFDAIHASPPCQEYTKAGALILAEIERLDRLALPPKQESEEG